MRRWIDGTKPILGRGSYGRVESVGFNAEARRFGDYAEFHGSLKMMSQRQRLRKRSVCHGCGCGIAGKSAERPRLGTLRASDSYLLRAAGSRTFRRTCRHRIIRAASSVSEGRLMANDVVAGLAGAPMLSACEIFR